MKKESPIEKFPGYVILPEWWDTSQVRAFEDAYFGNINVSEDENNLVFKSVAVDRLVPFILEIVEEWHIDNVVKEPSKKEDIPHLVNDWLKKELHKIWQSETQVPNE